MNEYTKQAIIDAYQSGLSAVKVAEQFDTSATTVNRVVKAVGVNRGHKQAMRQYRDRRQEQYALTGGRWVNVRGVMRWESYVEPSRPDLSDRERRIEWEEAMFDEDEARDLHARHANGCREPRTVMGERVYNRRKKRAHYARKAAVA